MTQYLRVKQVDTGHELTVSQTVYDFAPEAYSVLKDKPATDAGSNPLEPKYKTTVDQQATEKKARTAGSQAATNEGDQ